MRDLLLILLGMALVPLAEFIWAVFKHIAIIIRAFWTKRRKHIPILWRWLMIGTKHSLGGIIIALIIVAGLWYWLHLDDINTQNEMEQKQSQLIENMNKNTKDITDRLDKLINTLEAQNVSDNSTNSAK
jgi:predicted RND superfamily exporter protein